MQKTIVEIKKPCHVKLNTMVPDEKGRFCNVCQTSVIDFTSKTPDQIALYFQAHKNEKICGIYNAWEVKTDSKLDNFISYLQSKRLKFVAVFIIGVLVLTGCRIRKGKAMGAKFSTDEINSIENVK